MELRDESETVLLRRRDKGGHPIMNKQGFVLLELDISVPALKKAYFGRHEEQHLIIIMKTAIIQLKRVSVKC